MSKGKHIPPPIEIKGGYTGKLRVDRKKDWNIQYNQGDVRHWMQSPTPVRSAVMGFEKDDRIQTIME